MFSLALGLKSFILSVLTVGACWKNVDAFFSFPVNILYTSTNDKISLISSSHTTAVRPACSRKRDDQTQTFLCIAVL